MIYVNGDTSTENLNDLMRLLESDQDIPRHGRVALVNALEELLDRRKGVTPGKVGIAPQEVADRDGYIRDQAIISYRYVCRICGGEFETQRPAGRKREICDSKACQGEANHQRVQKHRDKKKMIP